MLDSFVHNAPGPWTSKGLLEHIVELFVTEDEVIHFLVSIIIRWLRLANFLSQSFQLIDRHAFRCLLIYQRPKTKESEIPHWTKLCKVILEKVQEVQSWIEEPFKIWMLANLEFILTVFEGSSRSNFVDFWCLDFKSIWSIPCSHSTLHWCSKGTAKCLGIEEEDAWLHKDQGKSWWCKYSSHSHTNYWPLWFLGQGKTCIVKALIFYS